MSYRTCPVCGEKVKGLCSQDSWGMLKNHMDDKHGMTWDSDSNDWVHWSETPA